MCARFLCRLSHGELLKFYLFRNCASQPHKTFPKGTELSETGPFLLARFCEADWLNSETKKLPARRPPFPCLTDGINGSSLCLLFSLWLRAAAAVLGLLRQLHNKRKTGKKLDQPFHLKVLFFEENMTFLEDNKSRSYSPSWNASMQPKPSP